MNLHLPLLVGGGNKSRQVVHASKLDLSIIPGETTVVPVVLVLLFAM